MLSLPGKYKLTFVTVWLAILSPACNTSGQPIESVESEWSMPVPYPVTCPKFVSHVNDCVHFFIFTVFNL